MCHGKRIALYGDEREREERGESNASDQCGPNLHSESLFGSPIIQGWNDRKRVLTCVCVVSADSLSCSEIKRRHMECQSLVG
jgi:hypothetical protein